MDVDSSSKFIGSLTKFLQSLCNGYVEFQRGVELVGHIYLNIDTGEKVDYVLHEKVNKSDENSVTFVSNSYHAQPLDKDKKTTGKDAPPTSSAKGSSSKSDDDDIVIIDHTKGVPGSTNSGTIPSRGQKRVASPSSDQRQAQRPVQRGMGGLVHRSLSGSNPMSSPPRSRPGGGPSATVTSQDMQQQDNINMGDMKLEQISTDELISLASQVGEGASSGHVPSSMQSQRGRIRPVHSGISETAGQPVWIKQETPDDLHGGADTGWSHNRDGQSDSSNSSSNLYPVMMHQNPAAFANNPVFPGFPPVSGPSSQPHLGPSLPGTSGLSGNLFGNPMPGTSGSIDPAVSDAAAKPREREEDVRKLCEAVMRVRSKELSQRQAAELYGIPRSTLGDRVRGKVELLAKRVVRRQCKQKETDSQDQLE